MKRKPLIFRTNYNQIKLLSDKEKVDPISVTVPNETYSLKDIVERFSKEYPKQLLRTGYYDDSEGDIDFDDIDPTRSPDFDLSDSIELKNKLFEKGYKEKAKKTLENVIETPKIDVVQKPETETDITLP
jgi:hypothetical protein